LISETLDLLVFKFLPHIVYSLKTTTQKQVESATKKEATKVETTKKENTKVEGTKKENTVKKEEATKKEETTKKDESSDKQASSVKTVSGKPQAPEANSAEKKNGWASNGTYYVNGKLANWWYDDGKDWYFFQDGKKFTGLGVDGNGQSELVEILTGLKKAESGSVTILGKNAFNVTPRQSFDMGITSIPEDRQKHGLVLDFTVAENLILQNFEKEPFSKSGILNDKNMTEYINVKNIENIIKEANI